MASAPETLAILWNNEGEMAAIFEDRKRTRNELRNESAQNFRSGDVCEWMRQDLAGNHHGGRRRALLGKSWWVCEWWKKNCEWIDLNLSVIFNPSINKIYIYDE